MTRHPSSTEAARLISDLRERGYCVLEEAWSPEEGRRIHGLLDRLLEKALEPDRAGAFTGFGCKLLSLRYEEPAMREYYDSPTVRGFLEHALEDEVSFKMTGVRWSTLDSDPRVIWHDHFYRDPGLLARRSGFERLAFNCYLDGSTQESGPLIVSPRAFHDPLHAPSTDVRAPRPEEIEVEVPPLSIVFMDSALYHCARRGTSGDVRTMWGGQAQARSCSRAHPEDTDGALAAIQAWRRRRVSSR